MYQHEHLMSDGIQFQCIAINIQIFWKFDVSGRRESYWVNSVEKFQFQNISASHMAISFCSSRHTHTAATDGYIEIWIIYATSYVIASLHGFYDNYDVVM